MIIGQVCRSIKNWFQKDVICGTFRIVNGDLELATEMGKTFEIKSGQYFRIVGSLFNDDVYQYPVKLTDEVFDGAVWLMAVPKDFIALCDDIDEWNKKFGDASTSPYSSESFGGYSYTKATGSSEEGASGNVGWQNAFRARLNMWRKL